MENLSQIVEALVFTAGSVLGADDIREVVGAVTGDPGPSDEEIDEAVQLVNDRYAGVGLAIRIHEWAGGFRMATVQEVAPFVQQLLSEPPKRLTRSLMETLSIVAYRQPVTKPEIDNVRGVDSNYSLRKLMEMGFVAMVGRSDTVGRPLLFGTTQRFLEDFGLGSLADLPKLREAEELFNEDQFAALGDPAARESPQDEDGESKEHPASASTSEHADPTD